MCMTRRGDGWVCQGVQSPGSTRRTLFLKVFHIGNMEKRDEEGSQLSFACGRASSTLSLPPVLYVRLGFWWLQYQLLWLVRICTFLRF